MSSSNKIEKALNKAKYTLLVRFMAILLLCLLLVEMVVGAMFFIDLYRSEKKILNSMASEYQRILTYDSAERLIHVMTANHQRLSENNIAAYSLKNNNTSDITFIAGDEKIETSIDISTYKIGDKSWFNAFINAPYMSVKIEGKSVNFWLILDNKARYFIANKQWLMTFYTLIILTLITALFAYRIISSSIFPLITLGDLLEKLRLGKLDFVEKPDISPQGLGIISTTTYDAIMQLHHVTTTLNITVDAIAHDIRTPLSRIILSSHSALLESRNTQKMQHALSDCAEYATQANNMLTALMKLNDEMLGKGQQQNIATNVGDIIQTVVNWYDDIAEDKNIKLFKNVGEEIIIQSDPDKLTQVLVNLLDNAIKYTQPNGKICLEAQHLNNKQIEISISDTGIGIDEQYQHLIFERLYRVDSSRSNVEGYGIGLSMATAMVENLGGHISLVSTPNKGATFTVTLNRY